jgi:membrane protein DedA with SNARE-associated domain
LDQVIQFLTAHAALAPVLAALFAAAETTAFLSVLIPSTALLMAVGAAASTGAFPLLPIWAGAVAGALVGSSFSWWLGRRFGPRILRLWPLRDHPALADQAQAAFARWGLLAVPAGHFFGPLRAVAFLWAGLSGMGFWRFQAVNLAGAVAWAWAIPMTGELGGSLLAWFWHYLGV